MQTNDRSKKQSFVSRVLTIKQHSTHIQRAMRALPAWVTPNGVTVFRSLLVAPIIALLASRSYALALATFTVAMILDFVDGALAEARNEKTQLGAFLDPLGDKIVICGTLFALAVQVKDGCLFPLSVSISIVAAFLTLLRVARMVFPREINAAPKIAANKFGKMKLISETIGIILVVIALALGTLPLVVLGEAILCLAVTLAACSFILQLLD